MEDITDEQLMELATKHFPNVTPEIVTQLMQQIREKVPEITNQQLFMLGAKKMKEMGAGGQQEDQPARFGGLRAKFGL